MTDDKPTVLIAGAGLGGLTAAIACAKYGCRVHVFEQAPALGEVGAGVRIGPNAIHVLAALGLEDRLRQEWFVPRCREVRVWDTGYCAKVPFSIDSVIEKYGYPHVALHRADFHAVLVDALKSLQPDSIHVNAKVVSFEQDGESVTLSLEDGLTFSGDVLIGADGLHSVVKRQLFGESKPKFTGSVAWRGTIPVEQLPPEVRTECGQGWMGIDGHFVVYRMRRGELINIVGHIERDDWQVESWTELGTTEEMLSDFKGWHPHIQSLIKNIAKPYKWALFLHPTMEKWSVGRVTLLGDACHPTLPYLGAGANMAIEDGMVLARCLDHFGDINAAFKRYEELRIKRTTDIVNASASNRTAYHNEELGRKESAEKHIDTIAARLRASDEWIYGYNAATVEL